MCRSGLPCAGAEAFPADSERHCNGFPAGAEDGGRAVPWRPLVLLIPLRLGLADVNAAYAGTLKVGLCRPLPSAPGSCRLLPTAARPARGWADPVCTCEVPRHPLLPAWGSPKGPAASGSGALLCEGVLAAGGGGEEPLLTPPPPRSTASGCPSPWA